MMDEQIGKLSKKVIEYNFDESLEGRGGVVQVEKSLGD